MFHGARERVQRLGGGAYAGSPLQFQDSTVRKIYKQLSGGLDYNVKLKRQFPPFDQAGQAQSFTCEPSIVRSILEKQEPGMRANMDEIFPGDWTIQ